MSKVFSRKFFLKLAGLFSITVALVGISVFQTFNEGSGLKVYFFDVGQGDSALIKTPDRQKILIDGGPSGAVVEKLGQNLPFYDKTINLMILTHPHADHLDGLVEVLKRYEVKKILATGAINSTPDYLAWLEEIKKENVPMEIAKAGQMIDFGDGSKIEILSPAEDFSGKQPDNLNNTSIVCKLIFGETSFLFTGDAEKEVEDILIAGGADLKADVLKVGHHGSKNSTSQEFLEAVKPKFAVISVGKKNTFGHPNAGTLSRLEKLGAEIFRTDRGGDIIISSDGQKVKAGN